MKNLLTFLLIAGLSVALIFSVRGCLHRQVVEHTIIQAAIAAPDSGRIWKDEAGRAHRRAEAATGDVQAMKLAYAALMDSVARLNKIRSGQIDQITWLTLELRGARTVAVLNQHEADGHTAVTFNYASPWLQLSGRGAIMNDSLGDLQLEYALRDSLIITTFRKPVSLFRKATFVDVASANPDMHLLGLRSIQVRERRRPWGIGFQLGATYNGFKWMPSAGVGISYNPIRF